MPKYLLIARDGNDWADFAARATPDEIEATVARYVAWSTKLAEQGRMLGGEKLKDGEGRVLRAERGSTRVTDGPHIESKEVVGGFWLLEAESYDDGVRLIQDHPHLEFGSLELREIDSM